MDKLRTRIVVGIAAAGMSVSGPFAAGIAHANDHTFLDSLRNAGVFIHKDAEPYVIQAGHQACRDLRNGVPPEEVGSQFPVGSGVAPAPAPNVYLDILQSELCPNALNLAPPRPA
ncbi:hypothetical protein DE4585_03145 [Mycobacteroides salmoniphilum]|uniref:DUF732 domain-containing protein n=1 Tax=Mycobacteroides salmoniphilum TaxID=404941 RepID=A0A4R8S5A5_9MYCO|nr:DUF732 domain-containing protein [Mycobacteroides salmoniphilum]TDZ79402.1 hypothetical protein DE4585_03145 [Mycobacteroides salmoniphilum]TDZ81475.1 hypothetical protein DE4586_01429 [Mycobacteroides salmoniphilum]TDZ88975.1 hypothetical protein DE4587_01345 [Mycobacteroides salmoniphilum]